MTLAGREPPGERAGVAAVVLAAGASQRLGRPKALLELDGRTVLEVVARHLAAAGVTRGVVVVGGSDADAIQAAVDPSPLVWARNPDPDAGRLGSVQVGLKAVGAERDVLLWPIDRPMAPPGTVQCLLVARGRRGELFTVSPVASGRGGHPVVLAAALSERLLREAPHANLREVLRAADVRRIVVEAGPEIHANLDTEEDYRHWADRRSP